MKRATFCIAILAVALGGAVRAQDDNQTDPGVARISVLEGEASVQRGDSGEWVAAALNAPLVAGDTFSTGAGTQAEIQFDYANMIRVASDAEVRLERLEDQRFILQIARGTVTFSVLRDSTVEVELNTPCISVRPIQRGSYRITVFENGESELTVRAGEAEVFGPRGTERLRPGQTMQARGSASDPEFRLVAEIGPDSWDEWNTNRDRRLEESQSYRYADRTISGAEDLDEYGSWVNVSTYGDVWRPRVDAGWSPYYNGRWVWLDYYGWTWVSYDPWGWAPYHYGRWFWDMGFGWCWWPGGYGARHHWSPALVAFFGYGHGLDVGFGFGRVGWVPLGPHEPYHRWYGRDVYRAYRNGDVLGSRMGMRRDFDVRSTYMNARTQNGMVGIDAGSFGRGGKMDRVRGEEVSRAGLVQGMLPVAPGRESERMSDREVNRGTMRSGAPVGSFAGRTQTRSNDRVSFEEQRRSMEQGARRASGAPPAANSGSVGWQGAGTRQSGETNSGARSRVENRRETQQSTGGANSRIDAGSQNRRYEAPSRTQERPSVQSDPGRSGRISQPSTVERQGGRSEMGGGRQPSMGAGGQMQSGGRSSSGGGGGQRESGTGGSGRGGRSR